jgi:anti-sigma-K factor RskA
MHRLAELDPAGTTKASLPDEVDAKGLGFVVSLEPVNGSPAERPQGPVLFAGQLLP